MAANQETQRGRAKTGRRIRGLDPMLHMERLLWDLGYLRVAGVDEVGLGPLAGPVVAAAVVFEAGSAALPVDDSKKLSVARREALDLRIRDAAVGIGIGCVEVEELDRCGVRKAGLEAMRRAVCALPATPDYLLVDACTVPEVGVGQSAFVRADGFIHSVAAASIIAKVYRDALMVRLDSLHPGYGFAQHMGYGTAMHMEALRRLGPSAAHRNSFAPVRALRHGQRVEVNR